MNIQDPPEYDTIDTWRQNTIKQLLFTLGVDNIELIYKWVNNTNFSSSTNVPSMQVPSI